MNRRFLEGLILALVLSGCGASQIEAAPPADGSSEADLVVESFSAPDLQDAVIAEPGREEHSVVVNPDCGVKELPLSTESLTFESVYDQKGYETPEDAARFLAGEARGLPDGDSRRALGEYTQYERVKESVPDENSVRLRAKRQDGSTGAVIVLNRGGKLQRWLPIGDVVCDTAESDHPVSVESPDDDGTDQTCDIELKDGYTVPGTYHCTPKKRN